MDWSQPYLLVLVLPAALALWWLQRRTLRSLARGRRWALLGVRTGLVARYSAETDS